MKKIISIAASISIVAVMFLTTNCNSDQAAVTPANTNTARVQNGTEASNIIYSDWMTVNNWMSLTNSVGYIYQRAMLSNITKLDQDMLNKGVILVYARLGGAGSSVLQLPFKRAWDNAGGKLAFEHWDYSANVGQITINIDPEKPGHTPPMGAQVRYVLTPGVLPGARKGNIDYSDYNAVKEAFNLPD